ncbi:helicase-like protein [Rhizobium sp. PP-CC-2G-626]|nr:helicase-like protein [Rhizobium sp. PP-CC-2G-626]
MADESPEKSLRAALSNPDEVIKDPFGLLHSISTLVNSHDTHVVGREMVIRALAVQDLFPIDHRAILQSLVKSVGLIPYLDRDMALDLRDRMLVEAHRPPLKEPGLFFHTLQLQIYRDILSGRNVVLSASTSVGKSMVVDAVLASGKYHHVAIIVPTIALIDETRRRLTRRFGSKFDVITHPTQESRVEHPTIFVLTQERALSRGDLSEVSFFVIDEFYKLDLSRDQSDRTVDLNLCFHKLAKSGAQFYLIGPNIDAVTGLGGGYEYTFIPSRFSTVALDVVVYDLPRDDETRCKKLSEILADLKTPTLVYCQSPAKATLVAKALLDSADFEETAATADAVDWLLREYPSQWIFIKALRAGIGIHHGNIPRALQQYVVRAFDQGHIKVVICTSTIIEGVNTVAENVVIYDKRMGAPGTPNLDSFTFKNIAGRAGRMTKYFVGKVFVLEAPPLEDTSYNVHVGVQDQDQTTPFSLIVELPDEDLKPISRQRIEDVAFDSPLSITTLRLNRHIPIEDQFAVHRAISQDLMLLEDALAWRGSPAPHQLLAVCEIIHDYIDRGRSLGGYGVTSGTGLKAELDRLRMNSSFRPTIDHWVSRKRFTESVSDVVENALRFMRRYVSFSFPRQLMAVSHIQAEIYRTAGRERVGDYSFFAARAESLFMESGLFALDEYGIPPELARRLGSKAGNVQTLEAGLEIVRAMDLSGKNLHPFEREILGDVIESLGQKNA